MFSSKKNQELQYIFLTTTKSAVKDNNRHGANYVNIGKSSVSIISL